MAKIKKIKGNYLTIEGKEKYKQNQLFKLTPTAKGMLIVADETSAELLIVGDVESVTMSAKPVALKEKFKIDIYDGHFGKIIDINGNIIHPLNSSKGKLLFTATPTMDTPEMFEREKLSTPLETGIFILDTMIPIGLGQRELIIGDRQTGKTSIALSAMINQSKKGIKNIYISIGQKRSTVIDIYERLRESNAIENTIILFTNPDMTTEQFIAPSIGLAIAEHMSHKDGDNVLVVIDDLTKHANIAREIALSVGRTPGREAYPTDIFYQHSSILEKGGKFSSKYNNGTITILPIVETVEGDIGKLIPSNIISITDGQVFTSSEMKNKGEYPAVDLGLSVSRTGSSVQDKLLSSYSKKLMSDYTKLKEVSKYAELSTDLSDDLSKKLNQFKSFKDMITQYGHNVYTREVMIILIKLYEINALGKIKNINDFSKVLCEYSLTDVGAKKIISMIKNETINDDELMHHIQSVFVPLIQTLSGIEGNLISLTEIETLKGVNNER